MTVSSAPDVPHEVDGIQEHDNKLPRWWLVTLYASIVFSVAYWLFFHSFAVGRGPRAQFQADVAAFDAEARARAESAERTVNDDTLARLAQDPVVVARGRETYQANCLACHGDRGQGVVGANLTDDYWLHGARPLDQLKVVTEGVLTKGMPAWGPVLGAEKIKEVVAFALTLRGTQAAGKGPEGVDSAGLPPPAAATGGGVAPPSPAPAAAPVPPASGG